MDIQITNEHITNANPISTKDDAIGLALKDKGYTDIKVETEWICINNMRYSCSGGVRKWQINNITEDKPIKPITLTFDKAKLTCTLK